MHFPKKWEREGKSRERQKSFGEKTILPELRELEAGDATRVWVAIMSNRSRPLLLELEMPRPKPAIRAAFLEMRKGTAAIDVEPNDRNRRLSSGPALKTGKGKSGLAVVSILPLQ